MAVSHSARLAYPDATNIEAGAQRVASNRTRTGGGRGGGGATCVPADKRLRSLARLRLLARRTQGNTKAEGVADDRRGFPEAERRPALLGTAEPSAATDHAGRARRRPRRICYALARIVSVPIRTPFPHIPVHVVQPPRVGLFLADSVGTSLPYIPSILRVPCVLAQLRSIITKAINRRRSGTARVLPFGLCRQTIFQALFFTQLVAELHRIWPIHIRRRIVVSVFD